MVKIILEQFIAIFYIPWRNKALPGSPSSYFDLVMKKYKKMASGKVVKNNRDVPLFILKVKTVDRSKTIFTKEFCWPCRQDWIIYFTFLAKKALHSMYYVCTYY